MPTTLDSPNPAPGPHGPGLHATVWRRLAPEAAAAERAAASALATEVIRRLRRTGLWQPPRRITQSIALSDLPKLHYGLSGLPRDEHETAVLLLHAMRHGSNRLVNLWNPGDAGRSRSYVDEIPGHGKDFGAFTVTRRHFRTLALGSNGEGAMVVDQHCKLIVQSAREPRTREIDYHHIQGWTDRTALPASTFDAVCSALQRSAPHAVGGTFNCAGGIGRSATMLLEQAMRDYLRRAHAMNRCVSYEQLCAKVAGWVTEMRALRSDGVMPDGSQLRMLLLHGRTLLEHERPREAATGTAAHVPMPEMA